MHGGGCTRAALAAVIVAVAMLPATAVADDSPFGGRSLFVDPDSSPARQAQKWRDNRPSDAAMMDRIAAQPQADWFGDWNDHIRRTVDARVSQIVDAGALPVLVAYNIPLRDCGGYSSGGARSPRAYRKWIRRLARGLERRPAAVVLEPDALAGIDCLKRKRKRTRLRLLGQAVRVLERRGASVYVDAGHSAWQPADEIAKRLRRAGVRRARGFALNVSNFQRTEAEVEYGRAISTALGGKGFVIDVSRNGLGPTPDLEWCNPPGRALGGPPSTATAPPLDALLWIKPPGESDGECNGGPRAGGWWPEYALGLARRAPWADRQPAGSAYSAIAAKWATAAAITSTWKISW
jgi:endoglucanase